MTTQTSNRKLAFLAVFGLIGLFGLPPMASAFQQREDSALGRKMTISASMRPKFRDDLEYVLQELQDAAVEKKKKAFLLLELHGGTGTFGQIVDAKSLLLSPRFDRVRTVAWIPEDEKVTGNIAILALACHDIVMHPDSDLGDIGEGNPASADVRQIVSGFVKNGHNPRLHKALVDGMLDPRVHVQRVNIRKAGSKVLESKAVTADEYKKLLDSGVTTEGEPVDIKMAGSPGIYHGSTMNELDLLVVRTAQNLDEVAAIYNIPPRELEKQKASDQDEKRVAYIKVERQIDFVFEAFLERQIKRAVKNKKNLIILEITSPGGLLFASESLARLLADLESKNIKTVAYVPNKAYSGATIIALGCDEIYMRPTAQIGDAAPILIQEGQQFERAPEKILSPLKLTMRDLAELKKRSPALLQAMVDKDLVVYRVTRRDNPRGKPKFMTADEILEHGGLWIKGPMVPESKEGDLLTVNGVRANELGLAKPPVANFDELKAQLGIPADMELIPMELTWVDSLIFWLNSPLIKGALFIIAIACIYLELHFMSGFLGIMAVLCFSLFFWSQFMGGTAGWLEIMLFLLGIGCVALEIFVIPGFGVFGVSGGLMLLASLVLASTTLGNIEPNYDFKQFTESISTIAASIVVVIIFAITVNRFLPSIPILNKFLLSPPGSPHLDAEYEPQLAPGMLDDTQMLVGRHGIAASVLRPAGKIDIDGKYFQVVSDGPYISVGDRVEVVEVTGNRIVVRRV